MYQQRARPSEPSGAVDAAAAWHPDSLLRAGIDPPEPSAWYLVVDNLDGDVAVLVAAPWPTLDVHGRLRFGPSQRRTTLTRPRGELQRDVVTGRRAAKQRAASRPLRIGDTFYLEAPDSVDGPWPVLVDVTGEARDAAKVAFYGAVTPRLDPNEADRLGLVDPNLAKRKPPRIGPGPTASPRV
ncbi:MAG TPA: hypothetical protein VHF25_08865 [Nitriliruptorales bacterium]|nr:hypothetical protein [Nitriliruptorales bacterium]